MSTAPLSSSEIAWCLESTERVDLHALLTAILVFLRKYVVLTDHQVIAIALWVLHTHVILAFEATPYLHISSAVKRSGKTRLLEVLETLVARPCLTSRMSAPALIRKVDADCPTLLLDEADAAFNGPGEFTEALRGILNAGNRRGGKAIVCVGQGLKITAREFSAFCPKAIAGIGKLPDTVADRSIPIVLQRRTRREPISRWRDRDGRLEAAPLHEALVAWGEEALPALRDARPDPLLALNDRAADSWEPLLSIADRIGGDCPVRARDAAIALMGHEVEDDAIGIQLLADLREIFGDADALPSHSLIEHLTARDDRPWATWSKGKPITGHALSRLLRPFGIVPGGAMRIGGEIERGYRRASFEDAFLRYLPGRDEPIAEPSAPIRATLLPEPDSHFDPTALSAQPDDEEIVL